MGWPHMSWTGGTRGREVDSSISNRLLISEAEWFLVCRAFSRGLECVRRWNQAQSNFITMSVTLTLLSEGARRRKVCFFAFIFINWTYKQDLLAMVKCYLKPFGVQEEISQKSQSLSPLQHPDVIMGSMYLKWTNTVLWISILISRPKSQFPISD